MAGWDSAESTILTAAAKVYAALKIAHPSGQYGSGIWVTLNIDGSSYQCRCDCTGVIQAIITVMGYNPNWGVSTIPGHTGDGWYLSDTTDAFVKDKEGNISPDWVVLPFDSSDVRPGDIRAASTHSHCDIFVDYLNGNAYGLNAGSTNAINKSGDAGTKYLNDNNESDLAATWTIQDNETAKVLRYVKGVDSDSWDSGNTTQTNGTQSLKSLDIQLKFIETIVFRYLIRDKSGNFNQVIPGFFPNNAYYPTDTGVYATDSYGDTWLEFIPNYTANYAKNDTDWKNAVTDGLVMMYTLDNSDPLVYGRTVFLKDGVNDYEASKGMVPVLRTQFPVHFRCVLTDAATHSEEYGRSSAFFTNQSSEDENISIVQLVKAVKNFMFTSDASGAIPECEDRHGYLFLHDEDDPYDRDEYSTWVRGMEE